MERLQSADDALSRLFPDPDDTSQHETGRVILEDGNVTISCGCGQRLRIPEEKRGSVYRCPKCGAKGELTG